MKHSGWIYFLMMAGLSFIVFFPGFIKAIGFVMFAFGVIILTDNEPKDKKLREFLGYDLYKEGQDVPELDDIWNEIKVIKDVMQLKLDLVHCETCGCLIKKEDAIKGRAEVRTKHTIQSCVYVGVEEVVYHPYYCKVHAPKQSKK